MSRTEQALEDIDRVLSSKASEVSMKQSYATKILIGKRERCVRLEACIHRYTMPGSVYRTSIEKDKWSNNQQTFEKILTEILAALRADIESGHIESFEAEVRNDTTAGFLGEALNLLKHSRRASAVVAGVALEQHLRFVAVNAGVNPDQKTSTLNDELRAMDVYKQGIWRDIQSWLDKRNAAAHAPGDEEEPFEKTYDKGDIRRMIEGINAFLSRGYENAALRQ